MGALAEQVATLPPASRAIAVVMVAFWGIHAIFPSSEKVLALVAGRTIPLVSNVLTSGFLNDNLISLVAFVSAHLFLSRTVEPAQGQAEYLKFIIVSLAGSGALTFIFITILYYIMAIVGAGSALGDHAAEILYTPICGYQGGIAALLVAVKQAIPDNEVRLFSAIQLRARDLPGIYLIATVIFGILTGTGIKLIPFVVFATYTAWFHLRFYHWRNDSFLRGDPSEDFRLATFFPMKAQPWVDTVATACSAVTKIGVRSAQETTSQHSSTILFGRGSPTGASAEAARRRERGVRALEERLGVKAAGERAANGPQGLAAVLNAAEEGEHTPAGDAAQS